MPAREKKLLHEYEEFESEFFSETAKGTRPRSIAELAKFYAHPALSGLRTRELPFSYPRSFGARDLKTWFGPDSSYGKALCSSVGEEACEKLAAMVGSLKAPVDWPCIAVVFKGFLTTPL